MIYEPMRVPPRDRGAALPAYQRSAAGHAPGSGVSARLDDSAGRIAGAGADAEERALAGLGRAIKGAADTGARAYDEYSKSKATRLITEYRREMNQALYGEGGILTLEGEAALDADERRASLAAKLRDGLARDAGDAARRYFTLLADDFDADSSEKARKYADSQRLVMLNRNDDAAARERADWAMTSFARQPDFDRGLGEGLWHTEQLLRREGRDGEALRRGLAEFSSSVFAGAISRALAGDDVDSAERLLTRGSALHAGPRDGTDAPRAGAQDGGQDGAQDRGRGAGTDAPGRASPSAWPLMSARDIADARLRIQSKKAALAAKAEAERKKAEERRARLDVRSAVRDIVDQSEAFPSVEEQRDAALGRADGLPDPALREQARAGIDREFSWRLIRRDARVMRAMLDFHRGAQGLSPVEALEELERADMPDEARAALFRELEPGRGREANPENGARAMELLRDIEAACARGRPLSAEEVLAAGLHGGLTDAQVHGALACLEGGDALSVTRLDDICLDLGMAPDSDGHVRAPAWLYEGVTRDLARNGQEGAALSDKHLAASVTRVWQRHTARLAARGARVTRTSAGGDTQSAGTAQSAGDAESAPPPSPASGSILPGRAQDMVNAFRQGPGASTPGLGLRVALGKDGAPALFGDGEDVPDDLATTVARLAGI